MKRTVIQVLLAAPLAVVWSGCGSGGVGNQNETSVWGDPQSRPTGRLKARDYALTPIATDIGRHAGDDELARLLMDLHPEADADDDGTLTAGELDQWARDMVLRDFPGADADKDGALTDDELEQWSRQQIIEEFPAVDANRDGRLTDAELDAMFGAEDGFVTYGASVSVEAVEGTETAGARDLLRMFPDADTDNDGTLSDAELDRLFDGEAFTSATAASPDFTDADRRRMAQDFPDADTDHDGTLSAEEEEAFFSSLDSAVTWDGTDAEFAIAAEVSNMDW